MPRQLKIPFSPFERTPVIENQYFNIPLIGLLQPVKADSEQGDYPIADIIANRFTCENNQVTLQVTDNAMVNAGIIKDDYLTIEITPALKNGNIAAIKLGERFYIRRFFRQGTHIRLETADAYPSIQIIEAKTPGLFVIGKVVSITRKL
jgi:SOS-response transcriptional repressor LexA